METIRPRRFPPLSVAVALFLTAFAGEAHADKSGVRPNVISLPGGPGTISGLGEQFEPTLNTGSATYQVDLDVPPGTAGFAKASRFATTAGRETASAGWGGRSTSGRCNGRRRMACPATARPTGSSGRGKSWCRSAAASTGWRSKARSCVSDSRLTTGRPTPATGPPYRFGISAGARVDGPAGTFRWALEEIVDVSGNRIAFTYETERGQLYLTRVDYNLRPGAARNAVELGYETRADALTDFRAGFPIATARRLASVRMLANGAQVRRYALAYEAGSATSALSRLSVVTMYGTDDVTHLPPLSLGYTGLRPGRPARAGDREPARVFARAIPTSSWPTSTATGCRISVHTALGRHEVALNQGTGFAAPAPIPSNPSVQLAANGTELADLNGDGIVDLLLQAGPRHGRLRLLPEPGAGDWGPASRFRDNPGFSFEDPGVRLLDFDGDGLVDVMQTTPTQFYYWRNNGDGSWAEPFAGAPIAAPAGSVLGRAGAARRHERRSAARPRLRPRGCDRLLAQRGLGAMG